MKKKNNLFYFIKFRQSVFLLLIITNMHFAFGVMPSQIIHPSLDNKFEEINIQTAVVTNNISAVKKYIAAKRNINEKEPLGGSTPLITASLFGKTEIAKLLIDAGADINLKNNDGSTALLTAALFCRTEIVKMLLNKGADKTIKNKYGNTAYELVSGPYEKMKGIYEYMEKMLSSMGLKLDYTYIENTRPLIANMLK